MKFADWEPYYSEIVEYFGFDRAADEEAGRLLSTLLDRDNLLSLASLVDGNPVTVCGNAPCLKDEIGKITGVVFAADAAAEVLDKNGICPDAIFTDLDGATDRFIELNNEGTIIVIHAHGDNMPLLKHWVPRFKGNVVGTTQATPLPRVYNFGGFTDGDRAAFAADELGASSITLAGFNLDDKNVDPMKRGKLFWARKLLALIGITA
ncbi:MULTISPECIES: 6-hydroxymethylpterin diphosphokinase MptE-like protein [unclassified Methanoregula]|uniref:6-hydroxymethylpterin diphosphokinase MptE-like protein n=1 Tax=unclassified Methanoregula TaxID=2649730 RepID=UPI0009C6CEFB|nr:MULTISPECIES: 6-hydroxymethylpterin diphosphokinase MptE-like protein [unclassified Methanoregula]OPX64124.1 MAG: 6-hydroxymethyl-7,8-dihydropterin pyrophosphokinase [Methanoregula sp. PtaB.Bin085]OPY34756.1 MAG: 6-hydroxymethyl-7,8-dihydropterin pyrophosphokinase [Methanoregula sp. PtaU1.Bin006]